MLESDEIQAEKKSRKVWGMRSAGSGAGLSFYLIIYYYYYFAFRATPRAYGGSQARGLIRAVAAGLHQSHSSARAELHLQPTPQLTAMQDP